MKTKLIKLKQTCRACPEQWEGETEDGKSVYARERHDSCRVELDGEVIFRQDNISALDALRQLFEIPYEVIYTTCKD